MLLKVLTQVAYPIVYEEGKGWQLRVTAPMFLPIAVGVLASASCAPLVNKHYLKIHAKFNGNPPPKMRLIPMIYACFPIPVGLFIFALCSCDFEFPMEHWRSCAIS